MLNEDRLLIQSSWRKIVPIADRAAMLFYQRLFEIDPTLIPRFAGADMLRQRVKLVQTLSTVIESLDEIDAILPTLEALGRRHVGYGARPGDYDSVGVALLWTLEQGLGADWNPALARAWSEAYALIAGAMLAAATTEPRATTDTGVMRASGGSRG